MSKGEPQYPGAPRLERFLKNHADQLVYGRARLVFSARPDDRSTYTEAIAAVRRKTGMVGELDFAPLYLRDIQLTAFWVEQEELLQTMHALQTRQAKAPWIPMESGYAKVT